MSESRIEVFADCHPPTATAQHKGVRILRRKQEGKPDKLIPRFFTKEEIKDAAKQLKQLLGPHAPKAPMSGALYLEVTWTFYWHKYELPLRSKGLIDSWVPATTAPDNDNLVKLFKDVLKELGFYKDDAHVSAEYLRRGRGDRPGIHLVLERYEPDYSPPEGEIPAINLQQSEEEGALEL
jgi:Holliday junction resolvase RusA-like endonuclease